MYFFIFVLFAEFLPVGVVLHFPLLLHFVAVVAFLSGQALKFQSFRDVLQILPVINLLIGHDPLLINLNSLLFI